MIVLVFLLVCVGMIVSVVVGMFVMAVIFLGGVIAFVDVDFGGGYSAAIDLFDLESRVEMECGHCFLKDFGIRSCIEESSEEHVAADAGEAVEVGDTHGVIVSCSRLPVGYCPRRTPVMLRSESFMEPER